VGRISAGAGIYGEVDQTRSPLIGRPMSGQSTPTKPGHNAAQCPILNVQIRTGKTSNAHLLVQFTKIQNKYPITTITFVIKHFSSDTLLKNSSTGFLSKTVAVSGFYVGTIFTNIEIYTFKVAFNVEYFVHTGEALNFFLTSGKYSSKPSSILRISS
jgi:hypothetical protein